MVLVWWIFKYRGLPLRLVFISHSPMLLLENFVLMVQKLTMPSKVPVYACMYLTSQHKRPRYKWWTRVIVLHGGHYMCTMWMEHQLGAVVRLILTLAPQAVVWIGLSVAHVWQPIPKVSMWRLMQWMVILKRDGAVGEQGITMPIGGKWILDKCVCWIRCVLCLRIIK